jgi:sugar (pentulose or hexulose) kinase
LEDTAGALLRESAAVQDLWICAEMHGFLLAEPDHPRAITPYISWQDQRGCLPLSGEPSTLESREHLSGRLLEVTGLRLRAGIPILNLAHLARAGKLPCRSRFLTLVDWLLVRGGEGQPRAHPTLAAGTGMFSPSSGAWCPATLDEFGVNSAALVLPRIENGSAPIGAIELCGRKLRVWGGLGDLQAAAHGVGFPQRSALLVNLGTGSQVLAAPAELKAGFEIRPTVAGRHANALTHIPAGRALNVFARFVDALAQPSDSSRFWAMFSALTAEEVLAAPAAIDLNVFEASWKYTGGGSISSIRETEFEPRWLLCAIAKSWLTQYAYAVRTMCPDIAISNFLLAGGLSRRGDFIQPVLESLLGRQALFPVLRTGEETLDGLLRLAEQQSTSHDTPRL